MGCFFVLGLVFVLAILAIQCLFRSSFFVSSSAKLWCGGFILVILVILVAFCLIFLLWEIYSTGSTIIIDMQEEIQKYQSGVYEKKEEYDKFIEYLEYYNNAVKMAHGRPGNWWDGKLLEKFKNLEPMELPEGFAEDYAKVIEESVKLSPKTE